MGLKVDVGHVFFSPLHAIMRFFFCLVLVEWESGRVGTGLVLSLMLDFECWDFVCCMILVFRFSFC